MTAYCYLLTTTVLLGTFTAVLFTRRSRNGLSKLADLPGPPPSSWLTGNLPSFLHAKNAGDADAMFMKKYGLVFRLKGLFNTNSLYLADPQAIQYVWNTCGYTFHRKDMTFLFRLLTGPSLFAIEGDDHARQRKILLRSFSPAVLREFVPLFFKIAEKAAVRWREDQHGSSGVIDIYSWLSRLTLDAVGQGAFSYDFGAIDNTSNDFVEAYRNLFVDMFHKPTNVEIASRAIFLYLPLWLIPIIRRLPGRGMKRLRTLQITARNITAEIVQREMQASENGGLSQGKDVLSNLVRSNLNEEAKHRLSDEELHSMLLTIIIAGHDTTSATLVWVFFELSRHPDVQRKLLEEIRLTRAATNSGRGQLGLAELESMKYTLAVIKETLRYYPIAAHSSRMAGRDELIPLSQPVKTVSGEEIHAIPIKRNERVLLSIWAYNRNKTLWGDDAEVWNPERFLGDNLYDRPKTSVGVYANLATFSSGVFSCPGWRFAVLEMQAVLITLIEQFTISPAPENPTILQASSPTLVPMVEGQEHRGAYMPLTITPNV